MPENLVSAGTDVPLGGTSGTKDTALAVLEGSLRGLNNTVDLVPTFRSVIGILAECVDNIPAVISNRKDFEDLASNIAVSARGLGQQLKQANTARIAKAIENVLEELDKEANSIIRKQGRTTARAFAEAEQDIDDLIQRYRRVEALFRQLHSIAILSVWRITNETLTYTVLAGLTPARTAIYDSSVATQFRRGCTQNTRQLILRELQDWASEPNSAKVYWMNGMAGTGKTTIAYSFCRILAASNQLAANFFCSRSLPECREVTRIVPTIASQLSFFCRPMRDVLSQVLESDPDVSIRQVTTQFEKLISEPLRSVKDKLPAGLPVVVIDALDECSDQDNVRLFLSALLRFSEDLPIKFFVTCRPDAALLRKLAGNDTLPRSLFHLHDIEESLVLADIEVYLNHELEVIRATQAQIRILANQSGRLFIFAATVVRYMALEDSAVDHKKRLEVLLGTTRSPSSKAYETLNELYTMILSSALDNKSLEAWDRDNIKLLLHTVVCAREPLSIESLTLLLQLQSAEQVQRAISPLHSVLHVDEGSNVVSTLHASFPDYMLAAERSGRFFCDRAKHHELLSRRCFETMKDMLRFNMCNLASSHVLDKAVPDLGSRVKNAIPPHLFYACRYWSEHLGLAANLSMVVEDVSDFLFHQVLFWTEVMNLKQTTKAGVAALAATYQWMRNANMSAELHAICRDAQKFISVIGASPVSQCTPHIYISVLAIWEKSEPMWIYYGTRMQKLVRAAGMAIDNREPAGLAVWNYTDSVFSVAVSPDGRLVASGSYDRTVCIWDSHTGQVAAGPLVGHTDHVSWVSFSPDGSRVASGSSDKTIRIWDSETGQLVSGPFEGHNDEVRSVVFSPDGRHLASGSNDETVRIWDAKTAQATLCPCSGHTDYVLSVAYSPDGNSIVSGSGSGDHSIRIWNAQDGKQRLDPLEGHTDSVWSVSYSPSGDHIVSGSADHTVRVWDSHSGTLIAGPFEGHTKEVRSVAYSPGGAHIVSSSQDYTIRIWDAHTGQTVAGPLRGHTQEVYAAVYMPDGNRIVSCSRDQTIRIWDARTRHTRSSLSEGHSASVQSVAFSPDGSRIVSGGEDCTVCIWDVQTGRRLIGPVEGHTSAVLSVAFSPSGDCVASASADQTIRLWHPQTGSALAGPLGGKIGEVNSVAFSPSGRHLVSGSKDRTVRVWDAHTGTSIAYPLRGHLAGVGPVAYSQDGGRIVSCSADNTLRVWDARTEATVSSLVIEHPGVALSVSFSPDGDQILSSSFNHTIHIWDAHTGQAIRGPLTGHSDIVWSVMYSPQGSYFISGSEDHTVRIWDAETGKPLASPFKAHTHWVKSVAFSPDSRLIASCSHDSTIRVWDTQKCLATAQNPDYWTMNEDGWVVGHDSSLLFWVPADLQPMLKWPQNTVLINQFGSFELNITDAALGQRWTECWKAE
ncbi:hypothetical protein FRC12_024868 [Ceratobasidium sp. 428]|nr:hypothetical protein FRC12_024868 [Ceratobasidium sp. 428]